jgi:hypothetical protein
VDVNELLSRLSRVRQTAPDKWLACCPAHADRTPSLTIRALADGRILLHDFGGCEAGDVMAAMGLGLADLFEKPLFHRARPVSHPFTALDALRALRREAAVVAISVADFADGQEVDQARLQLAADRIADAAEFVHANA